MEQETPDALLTIGVMGRRSGLTAKALRTAVLDRSSHGPLRDGIWAGFLAWAATVSQFRLVDAHLRWLWDGCG